MQTFVKKTSVFFILLTSLTTFAQGKLEDYKRAIQMESRYGDKLLNSPTDFHWLDNGLLWYVNKGAEGKEYLWVDPLTRSQAKIFDHQDLAEALSQRFERDIDSRNIQIEALEFTAERDEITFVFDKK